MSDQPDLSTAAQALEDAYEQIGDLGGSATEVKLTVSWVSPSGRPMSLSIGEIPDDEEDEDDIEYDDPVPADAIGEHAWKPQGDPVRYTPGRQ